MRKSSRLSPGRVKMPQGATRAGTPPEVPASRGPITLTFPWAVLSADNHRMMPVVQWVGGKPKARLITAGEYRDAKEATERTALFQWRGEKFQGPVRLHAVAWVPDERKRDVGNYRKLITDALTGVAYADDKQVHDERWIRAGVDRANPRMEITLSPMEAA